MLMIELSRAFRKDYRRVIFNPAHARDIPKTYESAVSMLAAGVPLPDHPKPQAVFTCRSSPVSSYCQGLVPDWDSAGHCGGAFRAIVHRKIPLLPCPVPAIL